MNSIKFSHAFYPPLKRSIDIETLNKEYKANPNQFYKTYNNNLFCPECHKARLGYVNASFPYLRSFPDSNHDFDCSLQQEQKSSFDTNKVYKSIHADDKMYIHNQLEVVLSHVGTEFSSHELAHSDNQNLKHSLSSITNVSKTDKSQYLRRKKLDRIFGEKDLFVPLIGYGDFFATWEQNKQQWKLLLWHYDNKSNLICRIFISQNVYNYLPENIKFNGTKRLLIAIFSEYSYLPGKKYKDAKLLHSSHLLAIPL